jgi:shikimate dehydrogenase
MKLDGTTQVVGVIGWPVEHSLSPPMHNAALEHLGLNWVYVPFPVAPDRVGLALAGLRGLSLRGLNVTIPHKSAVIPYLDEISREGQLLGAVNTITNYEGRLLGENTDVAGFRRAVAEAGWSLEGRRVAVLGAGGSARAVVLAALQGGAREVTVLNRTLARAEEIVAHLAAAAGTSHLTARALDEQAQTMVREAEVVVDCTSVGMYPRHEVAPVVPGAWLRPGQLVCDLTYNPRRTVLLEAASAAGAETLEGTGMLVHQGALALESWTGQPAPVEVMRAALLEALGAGPAA